jgi:hypothetical protein
MKSIEDITGKSLSEAGDILARQIRYVAEEAEKLANLEFDRDHAERLRGFVRELHGIRENVRGVLATADSRLGALQRSLSLRLAEMDGNGGSQR